jgi:hypothetical protein
VQVDFEQELDYLLLQEIHTQLLLALVVVLVLHINLLLVEVVVQILHSLQ